MTMIDIESIRTTANDLRKYAEYEGTELGEACMALIHASRYCDYLSSEFLAALHLEITSQLDEFEEYATIVEHEETFTRTVVSVEWE